MSKNGDLLQKINMSYKQFSKGQKLLANYILNNYEKAVFLTAKKLGDIVGVSESTVVRFATELGYDGYPKLQRALEELVKNKLSSVQRMEVTVDRIHRENVLKSVLLSDANKLRMTAEEVDEGIFNQAVDMILKAKTVYIIGVRSSAPLASFLTFYFNIIFDHVKLIHSNSTNELFEQLYRISEDDVLIGISFPRYSRTTLKAMEYSKSKNANIIAITDSEGSPMTNFTSCNLLARVDMASVVDSLVAPMSIINALIVAVCMRKQDEVMNTFASLEEIWKEYKVYRSDDENTTTDKLGE